MLKIEQIPAKTKENLNEKIITKEKLEAVEKFSGLINAVNSRYESADSTLADSPEQLKQFKEHNQEILDLCVERGLDKKLDEEELRILEVAAILHDIAKGDKPTPETADIKNYILAAHGEIGADSAVKILTEHPEFIEKIHGGLCSEEESNKIISRIVVAIKTHMGPHPGFMREILSSVNEALKKKTMPEIKHPYPEKGDKISETLLAADMRSLAGRKGREKVLAIRSSVPFFKEQDLTLCAAYSEKGIDLKLGEAALISGFESAEQARDMMKNESDKKWIDQAIEESKKSSYLYEGESIDYYTVVNKKMMFEKMNQAA